MNQLYISPRLSRPTPLGHGWHRTANPPCRTGGGTFFTGLLAYVAIGALYFSLGALAAKAWDTAEPSSGLYDVGNTPADDAGTFRNKMSTMVDIRAGFQRKTQVLTSRSAKTTTINHPARGAREIKGLALRLTAPGRTPERSAK